MRKYHKIITNRSICFQHTATARYTYSGLMSSILHAINPIIDDEVFAPDSFVNVSTLLCFAFNPYEINVSEIPRDVLYQYKEFKKKAVRNL